jgi:hypothetical protein
LNFSDFYEFVLRFQKLLNEFDRRNGSGQESYQRLVLMVVDALRDDFLDRTDDWPFVSGELKASRACRLTVTVDTPTVTMPRIKVRFICNVISIASHQQKIKLKCVILDTKYRNLYRVW